MDTFTLNFGEALTAMEQGKTVITRAKDPVLNRLGVDSMLYRLEGKKLLNVGGLSKTKQAIGKGGTAEWDVSTNTVTQMMDYKYAVTEEVFEVTALEKLFTQEQVLTALLDATKAQELN